MRLRLFLLRLHYWKVTSTVVGEKTLRFYKRCSRLSKFTGRFDYFGFMAAKAEVWDANCTMLGRHKHRNVETVRVVYTER
jgi:hypothetical protein